MYFNFNHSPTLKLLQPLFNYFNLNLKFNH
jgi:hypothetical protein